MLYFEQFPIIDYNITGVNGRIKEVVDIWRRVKVRSKIVNQISNYDKYDVQEGDTPESVAFKIYGNADLFWIIMLMNDIFNRYYDWPLDEYNFQQFVKNKYDNAEGIHHYEVTQSSGHQSSLGPSDYSHKIHVNSDHPGAVSVSNIQYERRLQDEKRQIKILPSQFVNAFIDEFRELIKS